MHQKEKSAGISVYNKINERVITLRNDIADQQLKTVYSGMKKNGTL